MNIEVLLTGSFGVGKSSIFNRFVYDDFSNKYYGTLGVRVNEKEVKTKDIVAKVKIWDIAGEISQKKVPKAYFSKKNVILYVVDLTRPFTFENILSDLNYLAKNTGDCLIKIVGSKKDLVTSDQLVEIREKDIPASLDWITSAKTGENINELFSELVQEVSERMSRTQ